MENLIRKIRPGHICPVSCRLRPVDEVRKETAKINMESLNTIALYRYSRDKPHTTNFTPRDYETYFEHSEYCRDFLLAPLMVWISATHQVPLSRLLSCHSGFLVSP